MLKIKDLNLPVVYCLDSANQVIPVRITDTVINTFVDRLINKRLHVLDLAKNHPVLANKKASQTRYQTKEDFGEARLTMFHIKHVTVTDIELDFELFVDSNRLFRSREGALHAQKREHDLYAK